VLGEFRTSVIYTDSFPLMAVAFKLLSPVLPEKFQYFGFMGLVTFMLNGACSSMIIRRFSKSGFFCIAGSVIYTLCPAVLQRLYGHETLACHYLIMLAMILWLYQDRKWGSKKKDAAVPALLWGLLGVLSVGTHMYYLPMTYCMLLGSAVTDIFRNRKYLRPLLSFCAITVTSLLTMYLLGAFCNDTPVTADGLGVNSANFNTYWNPAELYGCGMTGYKSTGSIFMEPIPVLSGQYEGYAYLGLGVIFGAYLLLMLNSFACILHKRARKSELERLKSRRVWIAAFAAVFALSFLFAASPSGTFNDRRIYDIYYPDSIVSIMASFRATGRFAWIGDYLLFTAVLYGLSRIRKKQLMIAALTACIALQTIDISGQLYSRRWYKEKHTYTSILKDPRWEKLAEGCDSFVGLNYDQPQPYTYAFSIFAYRHGMTINHFHVARPPINGLIAQCNNTIEQLKNGNADEKTLYVFLSDEYIPKVDGAHIYELDGFYAVKFPDQYDPLAE
jgi:hypothetical protein